MIRRLLKLVAGALMLAVPVLALVAARQGLARYERLVLPYKRDPGQVLVEVPRGATAREAVTRLADAGLLRDRELALWLLARSGKDRSIHAGEYRFERPLPPARVLGRLIRGEVHLQPLTIPEGLTRWEVAARVEAAGVATADAFLAVTTDVTLIADLDPHATDLEGYLFPDTYALGRKDGAEVLVERMVAGFRRAVGDDAVERARHSGRSLREVVILASLVEKETAVAEERPLIAGVYAARLRKRMLLQADPTVIYGLILEGRWDGDLKRSHLREDAPYNTYARRGLPPGPIAGAGKAALDAAFAPEPTDYLFFVSRNDGSHVFARTLREHNRNVDEHQRKYWRKKWREAGGRKKFLEGGTD